MEIANYIRYRRELRRKRRACKRADRKHELTGKRYYVIKLKGKYRVYSTADIKWYKRNGIFQKNLDHIKLQEVAVYKTK